VSSGQPCADSCFLILLPDYPDSRVARFIQEPRIKPIRLSPNRGEEWGEGYSGTARQILCAHE
jgi:hypothetical protein